MPTRRQKNSVMLAIDLTTAVADEAIERQVSVVMAYRKPLYPLPHFQIVLGSVNEFSSHPSNAP